jgi:hypothetical protein
MKNFVLATLAVLLLAPALLPQEHYTEGPVWEVTLIRVKPGQMDAYLSALQNLKSFADEAKHEGILLDYKVFLKETKASPEDWDVATAFEFKNHAALDGLTAKEEAIRDKVFGNKQAAQQSEDKRDQIREIVSQELMQEVFLK